MKEFWEELFHKEIEEAAESDRISKLRKELEANMKYLKQSLNRNQMKLLLRIEDARNSITDESNLESFAAGFKTGLRIGYESNRD